MRSNSQIVFTFLMLLFSMNYMSAAVTRSVPASLIQISPESSFLDLNAVDHTTTQQEASTPVRITVTGGTNGSLHPVVKVYACFTTEEAMAFAGKSAKIAVANLRIRNDHGEWAEPEPMAELGGCRGVRIAVLRGTSTRILLQVQLRLPSAQTQGNYQGLLTLEALEQ
jgi:Na+-transporting methylmalonyl-CoA/oxaloacetate decarboxylase gamma subunit